MNRGWTIVLVAVFVGCLLTTSASAQVKRWGSYVNGEGKDPTPTAIANLENVVAIDASNDSSYALESNGTLWAFGENARGQLGDGSTELSLTKAVQASFPAGVKIVAIGEAEDAAFAIDSTGQGWSWGEDSSALCLGTAAGNRTVPTEVPGMTGAVAVQGGEHHVLWLLKGGTLAACGSNKYGQLGVGPSVEDSASPIPVPGLSKVVEISAGERSSCARTTTGAIYDWGADANGQIGNGERQSGVFEPFEVPLPGPASDISCGGDHPANGHALALVDGDVYGWGADTSGQIGDEQTVDKTTPTLAAGLDSLHLTSVVASGAYSLGLNAAGDVYAWGSNTFDALGRGKGKGSLTAVLVDGDAVEISGTAFDSLDRSAETGL